MRLLLPTLLASWSRLRSMVPASTNAATQRSKRMSKFGFRRCSAICCSPHALSNRGLQACVIQLVFACTAWYIVDEPRGTSYHRRSIHEATRKRVAAFSRPDDLDSGHHLLRVYRSSRPRDDALAVLGELLYFSGRFRCHLYRHSALAPHRTGGLGFGDVAAGDSGNDRRSSRALESWDVYAETPRHVRRKIWSISVRYLRGRARPGRGCHASSNAVTGGASPSFLTGAPILSAR